MKIRLDELHVNNYKIYQDADNFCFGTDAVLLAWFSFVKKSVSICDLCTGTGIIPLLAAAQTKCKNIYGIEIQKTQAELAVKSVEYNNLTDRVHIVEGDLRKIKELMPSGEMDLVTANPPYMPTNSGFLSAGGKDISRAETSCTLAEIMQAAKYLLKNGGRLCLICRSDRLSEIFEQMKKVKIEPKRLLTIQSKKENLPFLVACEGILGAKPSLFIEKPLVLDEKTVKEIYAHGE